MLALLELDLGGRADLDHGDGVGELAQPLLRLLAVPVALGLLVDVADLVDALVDGDGLAAALDDRAGFLAGDETARAAEVGDVGRLQLAAELLADHRAAGQRRDVAQVVLLAVAEAGRLDGDHVHRAAQLVDRQRGQRLAVHIGGDDHQVLGDLEHLLEHREDVRDRRDLLVGDQDVRVVELRLHPVGVGDEVGRDVAAVELHAVDVLDLGADALALFDGDHAVLADLLHHLADQFADGGVGGGDAGDLRHLLAGGDAGGVVADHVGEHFDALLEAALQRHRVGSGGHVAHALVDDRLREHRRGGRAVAGDVVGLGGDFLGELSADVVEGLLEIDVAGDRHTVVGDRRRAEGLGEHDVAALGAERDLHRVGERVNALAQRLPRLLIEQQCLGHVGSVSLLIAARPRGPVGPNQGRLDGWHSLIASANRRDCRAIRRRAQVSTSTPLQLVGPEAPRIG